MALAPAIHGAFDRLAMWAEDRVARPPDPWRPGPDLPLDAFGPLAPAPAPPAAPARWRFPSAPWGGPPGDEVAVELHRARGPRRGTVLLVPPWKVPGRWLLRGWVRELAAAGLETWLVTPPHHLERAAPGRHRGEEAIGNDLGALGETLARTVRELRALAAAAARRGPAGAVGLSLGALAAAHAATAPERLDFAVLVAPPADLFRTWEATPIGARYRRLAERAGAPLPAGPELRARLARLSPAGRRPTAGRLLVAAGRHDAIVPPEGPAELARAWGVAPRLFPRGHLTLLLACRALRREAAALAREAVAAAARPAARAGTGP